MRTAEVRTSQDPIEWVRDGIAQSLSAQGYAVERVGAANEGRGRPVVSGTVTKVSADTALMLEGDIGAFLNVEVDGVNRFSGLCNGNHTQVGWVAASAEYQSVLASAMEEFISDCGPKLTAAIGSSALVTPASAPEPVRETPALLVPALATEPMPAVVPAAHVTVVRSDGPALGRCKAATVRAMKRDGASEREISGACQATLEATSTFLE